jgi:MoaA/NifB/PqqE/SkfB family radical SAM enzyme
MKSLPKNFCVAPFVQCTTHPSNSFSPCPYLGGTTWKSPDAGIMSRWRSDDLQKLRQSFINDEKNPICNRCWYEEDNSKRSLRLRLFDPVNNTSEFSFVDTSLYGNNMIEKIHSQSYLNGPEVLTIKNGNVCNAKCRVCHPGDSSQWISDAKKLNDLTKKQYYTIGQEEKNWSDDQILEIINLSSGLKRLELFGGEPMYNKKVYHLLEQLVVLGHAKNIILYINTNGSVNIVEKLPFIKEFKEIEIGVSIDGVGAHFNYIRHGLEYETVKENVQIWTNYFEKHQVKYFIDSISTVEILNVFYLPELKQAVKEILPLPPFWNLLVNPAYLFIKNMPDQIKESVIEKLNKDVEFKDLISVIQQPADLNEWTRFLEVTQSLDHIRNEDFANTFPEFANLIDKV